jgi:hypothetical protein
MSGRGSGIGPGPALAVVAAALGLAAASPAQELEPRAYSPNPSGANFVVAALSHTTGDVLFDPSLPFKDVNARLSTTVLLYGRTFGLLGRSASVGLGVPYVWGTVEGQVEEQYHSIRRSGLADARARLAINLIGGPAMSPAEFARRRPRTTLGASLVVSAPSGQYDPSKLVNLGTNRWSMKAELGIARPAGHWMLEAYAGAWLFTDNQDFFGGQRREQAPLGAVQAHVSYSFKPRLWAAGDATFYTGGRTTIAGTPRADAQRNSRLGLTLAVPLSRHQSVKASWATGVTTRVGGDLKALTLGWQYLWF